MFNAQNGVIGKIINVHIEPAVTINCGMLKSQPIASGINHSNDVITLAMNQAIQPALVNNKPFNSILSFFNNSENRCITNTPFFTWYKYSTFYVKLILI